jgi:hypothetical protein
VSAGEQTDLEAFLALLERFEIVPKVGERYGDAPGTDVAIGEYLPDVPNQLNTKVTGYSGFYTAVVFDEEGRFVAWGCWE